MVSTFTCFMSVSTAFDVQFNMITYNMKIHEYKFWGPHFKAFSISIILSLLARVNETDNCHVNKVLQMFQLRRYIKMFWCQTVVMIGLEFGYQFIAGLV